MDPKMSTTVSPKARVIKILNRIGARGIFTEVRVQLVDQPKMQFMRTVKGPVHLGDIVDFEDTELTWQSSQKSKSNFGDIC
ncbi:40S ribosomal protein S28 [Drosophila eugracilis]|uniref:40S ribosomal protein S28 n=1 Tax=Drosophila eugracilis TaxID=29029 RepID=UPI001BDB3138|nr:40S ribosomal protein S28 [Drosophila eugracilis]